ncbi:MAG: CDP-alcohol phosphatidyltransferase family protein [Acidobacteria bacterium]|nr:CDP-alcohol phosphatidyltransferase family protein [Acidobacteriota bacterium]
MRYPRRYNVVVPVALGVVGTAAAGTLAGVWVGAGSAYPLTAAAVAAATLAAIVGVAGHEHPFTTFGAANVVTTIRVALVALVAALVGRDADAAVLWFALALAGIEVALDGFDGWLARRGGLASEFGARFDMETDALLILVLSVLVWQHEKAGAWVLLCGLMRYLFVAGGRLLPWLRRPLRSTLRGKTVAVLQVGGLGAALAPIVPPPHSTVVAAVTLAALLWSFIVDILWLAKET